MNNELKAMPTRDDIISWMSEHDEAYTDFAECYGAIDNDGEFMDDVIGDIDIGDIKDWIAEHDALADDYKQHFGIKDRLYTVEAKAAGMAFKTFDDMDSAIGYCKQHPKANVVFENAVCEYETDLDGSLGDFIGYVYTGGHKEECQQYGITDQIHKEREQLYDELSRTLTDYEFHQAFEDELYHMLVKIQNNWESVITAK